jgi:hypothetical protein
VFVLFGIFPERVGAAFSRGLRAASLAHPHGQPALRNLERWRVEADDLVEPRALKVPKSESTTTSGQRSAAQNGQDSSLTKTIAGLPSAVTSGHGAGTVCSGVASWPALTRDGTAIGTVVACRTTARAWDSRTAG